jgi:hypothetical protein
MQEHSAVPLPPVIQGGMGVAVSSWPLARAVAAAGQLGVISGTALDAVLARRLQDGDPGGHLRMALAAFPVPEMAEHVLARYFRLGRLAGTAATPRTRWSRSARASTGPPRCCGVIRPAGPPSKRWPGCLPIPRPILISARVPRTNWLAIPAPPSARWPNPHPGRRPCRARPSDGLRSRSIRTSGPGRPLPGARRWPVWTLPPARCLSSGRRRAPACSPAGTAGRRRPPVRRPAN